MVRGEEGGGDVDFGSRPRADDLYDSAMSSRELRWLEGILLSSTDTERG